MANRSDVEWTGLIRDLAARVDAYAPGWTDHRENDPGITLVQLFGFLAESILQRGVAVPGARSRVQDVLDRLKAGADPCSEPLRRNRYASGMVLGVDGAVPGLTDVVQDAGMGPDWPVWVILLLAGLMGGGITAGLFLLVKGKRRPLDA